MGHLGKFMKGRANRPENKNTVIRVRNMDKGLGDYQRETLILKERKETLKQQMIEEQKMTHFNRMKTLTLWRKMLRLAKTEQLKKEIQIYQQNHDREVDAKDAIMQMLDRDLDEAEE
jgi:dynein regulatory complex subunit 2